MKTPSASYSRVDVTLTYNPRRDLSHYCVAGLVELDLPSPEDDIFYDINVVSDDNHRTVPRVEGFLCKSNETVRLRFASPLHRVSD